MKVRVALQWRCRGGVGVGDGALVCWSVGVGIVGVASGAVVKVDGVGSLAGFMSVDHQGDNEENSI